MQCFSEYSIFLKTHPGSWTLSNIQHSDLHVKFVKGVITQRYRTYTSPKFWIFSLL